MSKNDYWSEKENEKYEKFKVALQNNELNLSEAKKISENTNKIIKIICIPAIIIGAITVIFAFTYLILLWGSLKARVNSNISKHMEDSYGEKIAIISEEMQKDG